MTQVAEPRSIRFEELSVDDVYPNPNNPRRKFDEDALAELAATICQVGLIQPVVVTPDDTGRYRLVAGERRWRAARLAGWTTIPAIVRMFSSEEEAQAALIENLQRRELALSNRFIDTAKVRTPHVEALTKHIDSAHDRAGLGSGLGPVSQYGYVSFDDYLSETVVSGVAGYSFGEWMGFFDGSKPPRQCTWVVRGVDREKYEGRMVWVAGTRCWDPLSKHFFIAVPPRLPRGCPLVGPGGPCG
ncbi:MAG: ParB/RepB/Spo0J family partition protein [Bacillota bacterium]